MLPVAWRSTTEPSELLAQVPVCVAPKKGQESGFCAVYDVLLKTDADGKFVEAELQLPQSN